MSVVRNLQEQLQQTQTAKFVTTMLRDISATRLQTIRSEVERNKKYYSELHALMELVKSFAVEHGVDLRTGTDKKKIYIAITSNRRFYGKLNNNIMDSFVSSLAQDDEADGYVIGATGWQYWEQNKPVLKQDINFLTPSNSAQKTDVPTRAEVRNIVEASSMYNEVVAIHPTFINSFRQEPVQTDITHVPRNQVSKNIDYIVEPDIPALLTFFRTQVRLVLFERVILETRLALTGARLMKMQRARERATELEKQERRIIHKQISTIQNMRLLETFTGFTSDRTI